MRNSGLLLFRIFAQDVGQTGYSGVCDHEDTSAPPAVAWADERWPVWKGRHLALPYDRRDLWPDSATGQVPPEALRIGR